MENTQFRLDESKFFLERMKENKEKLPEFEYYLSAYTSSARSILWIMKSEYNKINEWEKWYDEKVVSDEQKKLLDGIVKMRNRSLKQRPLKLRQYITVGDDKNFCDFVEVMRKYNGKKVKIKIEHKNSGGKFDLIEKEGETNVSGILRVMKTVEEFKNKDIIDVCEEYDVWLTGIVSECIEMFG